MSERAGRSGLVAAVPVAFLVVFFVWPSGHVLVRAFGAGALREVLTDPTFRRVLWFTSWQAVLSTALTFGAGLPAAYVVARYDFTGRRLFRAFVTVPFVMPTVVVAVAFLALLRPGGAFAFLGWDRGLAPMIVAQVFFNVAVVVRIVGGFWANLDVRREDAARMLGASRARVFREVTLPLLAPALVAAASIVFLFTFTSFGVVLLLSDPAHATLEVEIYRQAFAYFDLPVAAALSLVQIVVVATVLWALSRAQERSALPQRLVAADVTARRPRGRERLFVAGVIGVTTVFLALPLVALALRSVRPGGEWSASAYRALATRPATTTSVVSPGLAIRNSVLFALVATVIALVVGGCAAFAVAARSRRVGRPLDVLVMLPLGASSVTVGLGFLLTFGSPPLDLSGAWILIPIAHALIAIPFVVRAVAPALRSIDPRLRDAAAVLGASPRAVWREVDLPIVTRAFAVAAGFCAAVSLGEFGATLFLTRPEWSTVPVAIQRLLGRPGEANVSQSLALATVLMGLTVVIVLAMERVRVRHLGEL